MGETQTAAGALKNVGPALADVAGPPIKPSLDMGLAAVAKNGIAESGGLDGFGGLGKSFISDTVGRGQANRPEDIFRVSSVLSENGFLDGVTHKATEKFLRGLEAGQSKLNELTEGGLQVDGIVRPDGPTEIVTQRAITGGAFNAPKPEQTLAPQVSPDAPIASGAASQVSEPNRPMSRQVITAKEAKSQASKAAQHAGPPDQHSKPRPGPTIERARRLGLMPSAPAGPPHRPETLPVPTPRADRTGLRRSLFAPPAETIMGQNVRRILNVAAASGGKTPPASTTLPGRETSAPPPAAPQPRPSDGLARDIDESETHLPQAQPQKGLAPPEPFIDPVDGSTGEPGADKETFRRIRQQNRDAETDRLFDQLEDDVREAAGENEARAFRHRIDTMRRESRKRFEREQSERDALARRPRTKAAQRPESPSHADQTDNERGSSLVDRLLESLDDFFNDTSNIPTELPPTDPPPPTLPPIQTTPTPGSAPNPRPKPFPGGRSALLRKLLQMLTQR